jgi:hypothetical protein
MKARKGARIWEGWPDSQPTSQETYRLT